MRLSWARTQGNSEQDSGWAGLRLALNILSQKITVHSTVHYYGRQQCIQNLLHIHCKATDNRVTQLKTTNKLTPCDSHSNWGLEGKSWTITVLLSIIYSKVTKWWRRRTTVADKENRKLESSGSSFISNSNLSPQPLYTYTGPFIVSRILDLSRLNLS